MESMNYDQRNRNFVDTLTGLTYDALQAEEDECGKRGDAVREPKQSWLDRLDDWLWDQELKSREAFLAKSSDIADVERRMRYLERGYC